MVTSDGLHRVFKQAHNPPRGSLWELHRDQVKEVRLVPVRLYVAPHSVGAVSNRTGPA